MRVSVVIEFIGTANRNGWQNRFVIHHFKHAFLGAQFLSIVRMLRIIDHTGKLSDSLRGT